jgi:hypothetical protein
MQFQHEETNSSNCGGQGSGMNGLNPESQDPFVSNSNMMQHNQSAG